MIDLHTHILPAIDDGAENKEVAAGQMQCLWEQGVHSVVVPPHYYGRKRSPIQFMEARAAAFDSIKDCIPEGMEVFLGAEVHFAAQMAASDESVCSMAIGDTRYLLIELPFTTAWDSALWNRLRDFIANTEYVPVVAHVERYSEVRRKPSLLAALSDLGCLLQMNTDAFTGEEKGFAFSALRRGYVDCLGTDTHNMEERAPRYAEARAAIEEAGFSERFGRIQENMRLILEDKPVRPEREKPVKKFFGRYY